MASINEIECDRVLDVGEHLTVRGGPLDDPALIDDGHATRELTTGLDPHVAVFAGEQLGVGQRQHGEWVVHGGACHRSVVVAGEIVGAEEPEQIGEHRCQRARQRPDALHAIRRRQELVRHVETGHHEPPAVIEHDGSSLRIRPDVELAGRRAIAERATAHQRDPCDPLRDVRGGPQRERDVRQGSDRNEPQIIDGPTGLDDERHRIAAVERGRRLGQIGTVEAALTVDERAVVRRRQERAIAPGVHRDVEPEEVSHHEGVAGRPLQWGISGDRRDADQVGVTGGGDDRHRVVVAGVAVEQDPRSHRWQRRVPTSTEHATDHPRDESRRAQVALELIAVGRGGGGVRLRGVRPRRRARRRRRPTRRRTSPR